jgi:hypothetical protein
MTHDREAGRVASWDGERGVVERLAGGSRDTRRLAFTAAEVQTEIDAFELIGDMLTAFKAKLT